MSKVITLKVPVVLFYVLVFISLVILVLSFIIGFAWWWSLAPFVGIITWGGALWILWSLIAPII